MQLSTLDTHAPAGQSPAGSAENARTPQELEQIVATFAASEGWADRVRLDPDQRWYERLYDGAGYDIWAISWMPAQSTGFHDHGDSSGAFMVVTGVLEEHRPGAPPFAVSAGRVRSFGSDYAHDVRNASDAPAISIHAYSPPLEEMNAYDLDGSRLVPRASAWQRDATATGALDAQGISRDEVAWAP